MISPGASTGGPERPRGGLRIVALLSVLIAGGCGLSERADVSYETPQPNDNAKQSRSTYQSPKQADGSIVGDRLEGSVALGSLFDWFDDDDGAVEPTAGRTDIRVNGHLWAAALDTVSFMPLEDANPESGIIKTGWYVDPDRPEERFRVNVFILSGELRSDGVRVAVFRQAREADGSWQDVAPLRGSATDLEGLIVGRARDLSATRA